MKTFQLYVSSSHNLSPNHIMNMPAKKSPSKKAATKKATGKKTATKKSTKKIKIQLGPSTKGVSN
ncbi:MAG: hypothetical protein JNM14_07210 [Ferruginibacter sp.]|nr:hypothetical protein [Ferruginibacter sp.]